MSHDREPERLHDHALPAYNEENDELVGFLNHVLTTERAPALVDRAVDALARALRRDGDGAVVIGVIDAPDPHEAGSGCNEVELKGVAEHIRQRMRTAPASPEDPLRFLALAAPDDWLALPLDRGDRPSAGLVALLPVPEGTRVALAAFVTGARLDRAEEQAFRAIGHGLALGLQRAEVPSRAAGPRAPASGPGGFTADLLGPITQNSIAGIYIQRGGRILVCNDRFAAIFGIPKDTLYDMPIDQLMAGISALPDTVLAITTEHCHDVLEGEVVEGIRRDGLKLWLWTQTWEIGHHGERAILGNVIDITGQVRSALALRRSELELRTLSDRLLDTQESERKRIAGELHDSLGQQLTAIKFELQSVASQLGPQLPPEAVARLGRVVERAQQAAEEVRRISMGLRPSMLDDLGIAATISWFCREFRAVFHGIDVTTHVDIDEHELSDTLKVTVFRILQEAFNNIGKHAQARTVRLRLERHRDRLRLCIVDDGQGFERTLGAVEPRGFGLNSMRERARLSGGRLRISSRPGMGTLVLGVWVLPR